MFSHLIQEHPSTKTRMSKHNNHNNHNGNCMLDPFTSFGTFPNPNQLLIIPESKSNFLGNFSNPNQLLQSIGSGNVNFIAGQNIMRGIIITEARKRRQIIHGARAMNKQLPLGFQRPTQDYDIFTKKPKQTANRIQSILDQEVAGGRDEFFTKPAIHPGTYKVVHVGEDMKKDTEDDITVVDYTEMPTAMPTIRVNGLRYETLKHIKEHRKQTLKDPEARFRHEKDREDLERIELSKSLRGIY